MKCIYSGLHVNEERKKVGRNKRSVSGMGDHAGNGLRPYPGLRKTIYPLAQMKPAATFRVLAEHAARPPPPEAEQHGNQPEKTHCEELGSGVLVQVADPARGKRGLFQIKSFLNDALDPRFHAFLAVETRKERNARGKGRR